MSRYIDVTNEKILDDDHTSIEVRTIDTRNVGGSLSVRVQIHNEDGMGGPGWYANADQIDALIQSLTRAKEDLES